MEEGRTDTQWSPQARTPRDKALAIDRVIHEFHYSLRDQPDRPTRPAGVNLIVGDWQDVVAFLDELSGLDLPADMRGTTEQWPALYASTYWPQFLESSGLRSAGASGGEKAD